MTSSYLMCGLGNQLFQISTAYSLSRDTGDKSILILGQIKKIIIALHKNHEEVRN